MPHPLTRRRFCGHALALLAGAAGARPARAQAPQYPVPYAVPAPDGVTPVLLRVLGRAGRANPVAVTDRATGRAVTDFGTPDPDAVLDIGGYPYGVLHAGALLAGAATGDRRFTDFTARRLQTVADRLPYFRAQAARYGPVRGSLGGLLAPASLDDCGAWGAALVKARRAGVGPDLMGLIARDADWVRHGQFRLPDGTLARQRPQAQSLWGDDMYMGVPFLAQMGALTGEGAYFDDAVRQVRQIAARLFVPASGLYAHGWSAGNAASSPHFFWGRANGWCLMATVELLDVLPEDHKGRADLLRLLRAHAQGLAPLQSGEGLWHQLLDRPDSYLETSCSAMFAFGLARAVSRGWIDAASFGPPALAAWDGVTTRVAADGGVAGVCIGTSYAQDAVYYYARPSRDDPHGYGPVLLAGAEVIRLLRDPRLRITQAANGPLTVAPAPGPARAEAGGVGVYSRRHPRALWRRLSHAFSTPASARLSIPKGGAMSTPGAGFIERNGLWTAAQSARAEEVLRQVEADGLRFVRIGWGDQHGIIRGKTVTAAEFASSLRGGKDFQLVTAIFDTTNHPIVPPFGAENHLNIPEMIGLPDGVLVPDPLTFRVLPWAEKTGWVLSDAYFRSGAPCPLSTRRVLRDQIERLRGDGYEMVTGLEFEFYVFRLLDARLAPEESGYPPQPPLVANIAHGYQYLTETRGDEVDEVMRLLETNLQALGLPLATLEDEWGPGQCEITFSPLPALEAADAALLFRSAVKQVCRRHGYHASFMASPKVANTFPSGWHMHQSLTSGGANAFTADQGPGPLSALGMHYLGGLLKHADATSLLTTPTVNGYKRQRPDGFAPLRAGWALENRGAMQRVIGGPGDPGARIENRVGEPSANPYLYVASQIIAGRDGVARGQDPGAPTAAAYLSDRPLLPASLMEALEAFRRSDLMRRELGGTFADYLYHLKKFEVDRFLAAVTDWEHQEYFEMY